MASRQLLSHSLVFRRQIALVSNLKTGNPTLSISSLESNLKVEHDRHRTCFTVSLGNAGKAKTNGQQETAILRYEFTGDREVHLLSTNVPVAFRGKGVAALLAKTAMDFVVEGKLKARVSCWYITKYIAENPMFDYKEHIVE